MGNQLSDNVDVLREQLKSLKNSVRIYFDDYSDMASDGKDSIDKNVGEMKDSINRMTNRINIQQITDAMTKISEDLDEMQKIATVLKFTPLQAASVLLGRELTSKEIKEFILL